jgi:Flp pilus assembly protein TadG
MYSAFIRKLRDFRRDERGVVLIMVTAFMVPLLLIVAVAIDFSQTLVVKRQLTAAVDAAALSVATLPSLDDEEAEDKAGDYIRAHYPSAALGTLKTYSAVRANNAVDVSATAELDTTFLRIAGYDKLSVTVNSRALIQQSKLEIVMVLDNTGSMSESITRFGPSKLSALKTASNSLVNILMGDAEESPFVRIGLVPFANAVNIGTDKRALGWTDEAKPHARWNKEHVLGPGFNSLFEVFATLNVSWGGCVRARDGYALTDTPLNPDVAATLFTPYFAPDEVQDDFGGWGRDDDIVYDNDYLGSERTEKYKPFETHYKNQRPRSGKPGPNYNCPEQAIQPLTNVKSTITTALGGMKAVGNTVIPEGLAWGWRVISPTQPFTQGVAYDAADTVKAIILLTDGENNVSGGGIYGSKFNAFGFGENGHLGADPKATLDSYTSTLCDNIKANKDADATDKDILLYTIVFGDPGEKITEIMRQCASDPSKYFNSPTEDDLESAFESIALGLSKLRLAR